LLFSILLFKASFEDIGITTGSSIIWLKLFFNSSTIIFTELGFFKSEKFKTKNILLNSSLVSFSFRKLKMDSVNPEVIRISISDTSTKGKYPNVISSWRSLRELIPGVSIIFIPGFIKSVSGVFIIILSILSKELITKLSKSFKLISLILLSW